MYGRTLYSHSQRAPLWQCIVGYGAAAVVVLIGCIAAARGDWREVGIAGGVAAIVVSVLGSMTVFTIEVAPSAVRWYMGSGWPCLTVARSDVLAARTADPSFLRRLVLNLSLFAPKVWSFDFGEVVEVEMRDGRRYYLGTNEPGDLIHALAPAEEAVS